MEPFVATFTAVAFVELTDRTRLIAMLLSAKYRMPFQLVTGMTLGYVPAIAVAIWGAGFLSQLIPFEVLRWFVALTFVGFGVFLLRHKDKDEKDEGFSQRWLSRIEKLGPFIVGFILVAVTEFADKSQIATAGLMMKYQAAGPVFLGSLSAQACLNIVYVGLGHYMGQRLPTDKIRWFAGLILITLGILALVGRTS